MNTCILKLSLVVWLVYSVAASASVYRCVIDGVTTFSQTPCADNAEILSGYDTTPTRTSPQASRQPVGPSASQNELDQLSEAVRKRRLNRQVQQLEQRVSRLQREYEEAFAQLTGEPLSEVDGVKAYPMGLAQEISALRDSYNSDLKKTREELQQRRKALEDLRDEP